LSWLVFTILSVMLIIFYKRIKPVEGLKIIDAEILCEIKKNQNVKILDIRDPMDFEKKSCTRSNQHLCREASLRQ
jgi:hypothetical protein